MNPIPSLKLLRREWLFIGLIALAWHHSTLALSTDEQQPMRIVADTVQIDHETGTNVYHKHVQVDQGTTHLTAELMVTHNNNRDRIQEIIATGNQAIYRTMVDMKKPELVAIADTIKYYPSENKVLLLGKAKVIQGDNVFTGPVIEYNTKLQTVISQANKLERTSVIINPNKPSTLVTHTTNSKPS